MKWKIHHFVLILLIIIFILIIITYIPKHISYTNSIYKPALIAYNLTKTSSINEEDKSSNVLLIYVYANTHSHSYGNLKYFIDIAVRENDSVDYVFILQRVNNKTINESEMPDLPKSNAYYIQHDNICFDFGTIGWFFNEFTFGNPWINQTDNFNQTKKLNLNKYKYFIFMNSSIRGPFFPPIFLKFILDYKKNFEETFYWYHIFTKRINSKVKLVGCTINCYITPHVQSYIIATDLIGLKLMLKPGAEGGSTPDGIFGCYPEKNHVSLYSELPMSNRIRDAGYMIDSLLTKYQGINFNEKRNHECNQYVNPYLDNSLEGTSLEPYEVVFVKYNDLEYLQISKEKAKLYQRWTQDTKEQNRSTW